MTKALEALEAKTGHTFTVEDWRRIGKKSLATLSDDDLIVLEAFGGSKAAENRRRQRDLAHATPSVRKKFTVEFPDTLPNDDESDPIVAFDKWSKKHQMKAVPVALWWGFVTGARQRREELEARVATLEQELAAMRAKPALKDAGIWKAGNDYALGDVAQFSGSAWLCTKAHTATGPTVDHSCWRLWIKRGRDGKDAGR